MNEKCKNCLHFNEQSYEYDWCHMCAMEVDCYKPIVNKWIDINYTQWPGNYIRACSNCGWYINRGSLRAQDLNWKYCPNCGVRME